ncbi:MFS monocarboxylate transporter [Aspergillus sp. HF37]|nr:MFS monocarboxylate transporter [Aspergillus sp. HF37]
MLTSTFALFEICNIVEALGFFLSSIYLPIRPDGNPFQRRSCILLSSTGFTLGVFLLWGFSLTLPPLLVFSIIYGLFAGSYTSTSPGIMRDVVRKKNSAGSSMVFACLAAGPGIGNIISGPLSETLLQGQPWKGQTGYGYGSGYGTLVVFTGITGFIGGGSFVAHCFKWL